MNFHNRILGGLAVLLLCAAVAQAEDPNIVFIMADDMGVGDGPRSIRRRKVEPPNLDALVAEGMHFADAHISSAVCTPDALWPDDRPLQLARRTRWLTNTEVGK